jgi:riboflavin synthase
MFTGIIEAVGLVKSLEKLGGDLRFELDTGDMDMSDVQKGDSIAVNGVCLTAIEHDQSSFIADVSNETISLTTLQHLKTGSPVNLEKALLPTTRLGGHLVSGHVDGVGTVVAMSEDARSITLLIEAPEELKKYIAVKGSVCIDGTSLTVNSVDNKCFSLNIVPHTQERTVIQYYKKDQKVNIEVDLIARYLERLLLNMPDDKKRDVDMELLARAGFV